MGCFASCPHGDNRGLCDPRDVTGGTVVGVLLGTMLVGGFLASLWVIWIAARRSPSGISRRLAAHANSIDIKVSSFGYAWNPATPRRDFDEQLHGPGWATYRLDGDGLVHLEYVRKGGERVERMGRQSPSSGR